jgi:hypothetical protein
MNYPLIQRKIKYYCDWWNDLTLEQKKGWLGHWIRERISKYDECIKDYLKEKEKLLLIK